MNGTEAESGWKVLLDIYLFNPAYNMHTFTIGHFSSASHLDVVTCRRYLSRNTNPTCFPSILFPRGSRLLSPVQRGSAAKLRITGASRAASQSNLDTQIHRFMYLRTQRQR